MSEETNINSHPQYPAIPHQSGHHIQPNKIFVMNVDCDNENLSALMRECWFTQPIAVLIQDSPFLGDDYIQVVIPRYDYNVVASRQTNGNMMAGRATNLRAYDNMILLRKDFRHVSTFHESQHMIGIIVEGRMGRAYRQQIALVSVYMRPRVEFKIIKQSIDKFHGDYLRIERRVQLILAGDLNATDIEWAPIEAVDHELDTASRNQNIISSRHYTQLRNTRGRLLVKSLIKPNKFTCISNPSDGPTHTRNNCGSYIDVVMVNDRALRSWKRVELMQIGSANHRLGIVSTMIAGPNNQSQPPCRIHKFKYGKICQRQFVAFKIEAIEVIRKLNRSRLNRISAIEYIDQLGECIIKHLIQAQEAVRSSVNLRRTGAISFVTDSSNNTARVDVTTARHDQDSGSTGCAAAAYEAIRLRRGVRRLNRHRVMCRMEASRTTTAATASKRRLQRLKQRIMRQLEKRSTCDMSELWSSVGRIRSNIQMSRDGGTRNFGLITSKAQLEEIADVKFNSIELSDEMLESPDLEPPRSGASLMIKSWEFDEAIKRIRSKRFRGPEGLNFATLIKSIPFIRGELYKFVQMSFEHAYIAKCCRMTVGRLIPKKKPGSFRIVHIGSPLAALVEQVGLCRLDHALESNHCYSPYQFGFTAKRSRHDVIARVIELTLKNQIANFASRESRLSTLISIDVKGAFDNVDQQILKRKLIEKLGHDKTAYWLHNFVHNRRIKIKSDQINNSDQPGCHDMLESEPRLITRGVPQGSCLGPILWNFVIAEIHEGVHEEGVLELLAFADDILIIYLGSDWARLQTRVNLLIDRLKDLKLDVEPDKCLMMTIEPPSNRRTRIQRQLTSGGEGVIVINGTPIPRPASRSMLLLGIPITDTLRLDTNHDRFALAIRMNVQLLKKLQRIKLINSTKQWKVLIDSYLVSILIINNLPILAIDTSGRKWCDKFMARALKLVFEWAPNVSTKLARLVTGTPDCRSIVNEMMSKEAEKQFEIDYKFLLEVMNRRGIKTLRVEPFQSYWLARRESLNDAPYERRYHDPNLGWQNISTVPITRHNMDSIGPFWILIEGVKMAHVCEIFINQRLQTISARHASYAISYFHMFALLMHMSQLNNVSSKLIAFASTNPVLAALKNLSNHDYRVIELRESLVKNGWQYMVLARHEYERIKEMILADIKKELNVGSMPNNIVSISTIRAIEEQGATTDEVVMNSVNIQPRNMPALNLQWPDLSDYIRINALSKKNRESNRLRMQMNNTTLTSLLLPPSLTKDSSSYWQKMPPSWRSGKAMLMLTGMMNDERGVLIRGDLQDGMIPHGCAPECRIDLMSIVESTAASTARARAPIGCYHTTLHRAFECPRQEFVIDRRIIRQTMNEAHSKSRIGRKSDYSLWRPWDFPTVIQETLADKMSAQLLMRFLTDVAFILD